MGVCIEHVLMRSVQGESFPIKACVVFKIENIAMGDEPVCFVVSEFFEYNCPVSDDPEYDETMTDT